MADKFVRTANEELQDRLVRHQLWITRFASKEANDITALLEDVEEDVVSRIAKRMRRAKRLRIDTGPVTTKRLKELSTAAHEIIDISHTEARRGLTGSLYELSKQEAEFGAGILKKAFPVELETVLPDAQTLRTLVTAEPFAGHALGDWFDGLKVGSQRRLRRSLQVGIASGDTVPQIGSRIREALGVGRRDAAAIARSSVIHTASTARHETFQENSRVIKGIQWTATLDARTCPVCMGLDGRVFPLDARVQKPPNHVGCRCTMVPLLKSWKELGINLKEAPQGTRASMGGQVPSKLRYGTWLRQQPIGVQNEALGVARAKLFRSGKVKVGEFTDRRNRILTLDQLARLEQDVVPSIAEVKTAYKGPNEKEVLALVAKKSHVSREINKLKKALADPAFTKPGGESEAHYKRIIRGLEAERESLTQQIEQLKGGLSLKLPTKTKLPPQKAKTSEEQRKQIHRLRAKKSNAGRKIKKLEEELRAHPDFSRMSRYSDWDEASNRIRAEIRELEKTFASVTKDIADIKAAGVGAVDRFTFVDEHAKLKAKERKLAIFRDEDRSIKDRLAAWEEGDKKIAKLRALEADLPEGAIELEVQAVLKERDAFTKAASARAKLTGAQDWQDTPEFVALLKARGEWYKIKKINEASRAVPNAQTKARNILKTEGHAYKLDHGGFHHYNDEFERIERVEGSWAWREPKHADFKKGDRFVDDLLKPDKLDDLNADEMFEMFGEEVVAETTGDVWRLEVYNSPDETLRAFYKSWPRPEVNFAKNTNARTVVHELGHAVEDKTRNAKRHLQKFYNERTQGEELSSIYPDSFSESVSQEMGRRDKFAEAMEDAIEVFVGDFDSEYGEFDRPIYEQARKKSLTKKAKRDGHYVGKIYADGSTELLSMGMELLYADPGGFARRDPEWCKLVLAILDGSFR